MAENKLCAGCLRDDEVTEGDSWCSDCGEFVCKPCGKAHKRFASPHKVVPLDQIKDPLAHVLKLSKNCEIHTDQKIIMFCCQHDKLTCAACLPQFHQSCTSVIPIEKAAMEIRNGSALQDLKKRMTNLSKVFEDIISETINGSTKLDEQKTQIKNRIAEKRKKIDLHLDKIQFDLESELDEHYTSCKEKSDEIKRANEIRFDEVKQWTNSIESFQDHGSEICLFQAVKFLDRKIHTRESTIRDLVQKLTSTNLHFRLAEKIDTIELIKLFGTVALAESPMNVSVGMTVANKSQVILRTESKNTIPYVSSFMTAVLGRRAYVESAFFISENRLLLSNREGYCLYTCNRDGSDHKRIMLDEAPRDVTLYDSQILVAMAGTIQMVDPTSCISPRNIMLGTVLRITSINDRIWVKFDGKTLGEIDINGKVLKKIKTDFMVDDICASETGGLYCSEVDTNLVYRIRTDGIRQKFYSSPDLRGVISVEVDDMGNVYMTGQDSNNIHKVSSDGSQSQIILTADNGIKYPMSITYNNRTNELLVVNECGAAVAIYKIN